MKKHPLTAVADRIDPAAVYQSADVAELLEVSLQMVYNWRVVGWLPGWRQGKGPGRRWEWTGKALLAMARRKHLPRLDHKKFAPSLLWRVGCRCRRCSRAHTAATRVERNAVADALFPQEKRDQVLERIGEGAPVADAASEVEVSRRQVYGAATRDPEFRERLDEAGWALCDQGPQSPVCGTSRSWRAGCRGTGCRGWRRESSAAERASR